MHPTPWATLPAPQIPFVSLLSKLTLTWTCSALTVSSKRLQPIHHPAEKTRESQKQKKERRKKKSLEILIFHCVFVGYFGEQHGIAHYWHVLPAHRPSHSFIYFFPSHYEQRLLGTDCNAPEQQLILGQGCSTQNFQPALKKEQNAQRENPQQQNKALNSQMKAQQKQIQEKKMCLFHESPSEFS